MSLSRPTALLFAALSALPAVHAAAYAAGFDCKAAASPTERAICADRKLRDLDAALAGAYAQALQEKGDHAALRQQQRDWLKTRDACGADARCLTNRYRERIASFGRPDAGDMAALEELRAAVEAARRSDPEFPLEKAIQPLEVPRTGTTGFDNIESAGGGEASFPTVKPKDVSDAEWRALRASHVDGGGEGGRSHYTLMDLDGDGLRDLVVDSYAGGTGLFTEVRVLRQEGGRFVVPGVGVVSVNATDLEEPGPAYLYAYGERGANAGATWVRLHGRLYALYRESGYGHDSVSLLRPWASRGKVPGLTVKYRYALSAPALQPPPNWEGPSDKRPMARLDPALHRALNAALARVNPSDTEQRTDDAPICPVPPGASDEARANSFGYGPGHYTIEVVADFPVQVGKTCYVAQLRDWFGSYTKDHGLAADLCMRRPEEAPDPEKEQCYAVDGKRTAIAVTAGAGPFDQ